MFYRYLFIDIETIASPSANEMFSAREYAAPSNYKDAEKIAANIAEQRKKDIERAALHWTTGQIVCISAVGDWLAKAYVWFGMDEKKILLDFFEFLGNQINYSLCGKGVKNFDLPFIIGRTMANNLIIPRSMRAIATLNDIDEIFGYSQHSGQRASLSDYAFALGIKGKTNGISGGDVAGLVKEEQWELLTQYCAHDSEIAAEIMKKYLKDA